MGFPSCFNNIQFTKMPILKRERIAYHFSKIFFRSKWSTGRIVWYRARQRYARLGGKMRQDDVSCRKSVSDTACGWSRCRIGQLRFQARPHSAASYQTSHCHGKLYCTSAKITGSSCQQHRKPRKQDIQLRGSRARKCKLH